MSPVVMTLKFAVCPGMTVRFCGCEVITGSECTVSVAGALVTEPNAFAITTVIGADNFTLGSKSASLSAAPTMFEPNRRQV